MTIQYASDLHLEFHRNEEYLKQNPIKPVGEVLVLAGDIVPFSKIRNFDYFFDSLSANFEMVYWIPGNHEYYHSELTERFESLYENIRNNVVLLNNQSIVHEDVQLIFSTLWSKISPVNAWRIENSINDFRYIRYNGNRLNAAQFNNLHKECLRFLEEELYFKKAEKQIVVTHHVSTFLNYPEKYRNDMLNDAFGTELTGLIEKTEPDYWIYGHHHSNIPEFKIGETKLCTNQLGYVSLAEHHLFQTNRKIEFLRFH